MSQFITLYFITGPVLFIIFNFPRHFLGPELRRKSYILKAILSMVAWPLFFLAFLEGFLTKISRGQLENKAIFFNFLRLFLLVIFYAVIIKNFLN